MVGIIFVVRFLKARETYITLEEVIPQARIVSHEDGIIEYKGVEYILGTNKLKRRKDLIESLNLLNLEDSYMVDLRFRSQVIIKKGPTFNKNKQGPENMQSRRR